MTVHVDSGSLLACVHHVLCRLDLPSLSMGVLHVALLTEDHQLAFMQLLPVLPAGAAAELQLLCADMALAEATTDNLCAGPATAAEHATAGAMSDPRTACHLDCVADMAIMLADDGPSRTSSSSSSSSSSPASLPPATAGGMQESCSHAGPLSPSPAQLHAAWQHGMMPLLVDLTYIMTRPRPHQQADEQQQYQAAGDVVLQHVLQFLLDHELWETLQALLNTLSDSASKHDVSNAQQHDDSPNSSSSTSPAAAAAVWTPAIQQPASWRARLSAGWKVPGSVAVSQHITTMLAAFKDAASHTAARVFQPRGSTTASCTACQQRRTDIHSSKSAGSSICAEPERISCTPSSDSCTMATTHHDTLPATATLRDALCGFRPAGLEARYYAWR